MLLVSLASPVAVALEKTSQRVLSSEKQYESNMVNERTKGTRMDATARPDIRRDLVAGRLSSTGEEPTKDLERVSEPSIHQTTQTTDEVQRRPDVDRGRVG